MIAAAQATAAQMQTQHMGFYFVTVFQGAQQYKAAVTMAVRHRHGDDYDGLPSR
jgi:hypothetical protein